MVVLQLMDLRLRLVDLILVLLDQLLVVRDLVVQVALNAFQLLRTGERVVREVNPLETTMIERNLVHLGIL